MCLLFWCNRGLTQEVMCGLDASLRGDQHLSEEQIRNIEEIEDFTQQWIYENQSRVGLREIITIPVVVHVLYTDESENFSDFEIQAQIDGLSADFRKMNENISTVPAVFQSLVADTEVEFCLASIDPDGKDTNGIVRKNTNQAGIGTLRVSGRRAICYDTYGGSDAWDQDKYINIWVGQMAGQPIGEATMPGQVPFLEEDGIIIDPVAFGFFCSTVNGFYLGRTLTHEMGHFLNLYHLWGEGGCNGTDFVEDTPVQMKAYSGCPMHPQVSCGTEDMFMNFMNYVDDNCLAMFTEGQKMRMLATLDENGIRGSLRNSNRCDLVTNPIDITLTKDDISIFPNPASDCIHIDLDIDNDLPVRMFIFNTMGQTVYSAEVFVKDLRTFDISHYSNGIYFISFETNDQIASTKLIIDK
ncbi:MAG: M43 family zinc metalloprotease [Bacteroidota bacterium]